MENLVLKKGLVRMTYMDTQLGEEVLAIESRDVQTKEMKKVIIPKSEVSNNTNLLDLVGKLVDYVELENGLGSMTKAMPQKRKALLDEFNEGKLLSARITKILRWGANLSINGVACIIRNCDFASDYTTIKDVYSEGDIIDGLKFRKISVNDRISVEKFEKYKSDTFVDLSQIEEGNIILGTIRNVKPFGCFVAVANNIDALCPIPLNAEIEEGMKVKCRLSIVDFEESKIRGKILSIVDEIIEE